tara:strand:- start:3231 stop:4568 length:1338 start_codon:yes stop_codon:yes gene_type:complete
MLLNDIINLTIKEKKINTLSWCNTLLNVLREYHYWPALQIKKINNSSELLLLHNTYRRKDIESFKELYDECRSVILDFSDPEDKIILSKSNSIPERISDKEYLKKIEKIDYGEIIYDCTTIYVYFHKNMWYFGTTTVPNIDYSKFTHPIKKYGMMFDEILNEIFKEKEKENIRENLTDLLNKDNIYEFGILHYENTHYFDYSNLYGKNYKKLILIKIKEKYSNKLINNENLDKNLDLIIPEKINNTLIESYLNNNNIYGLLINDTYKVSNNSIIFHEETDHGNPNPWRNMLWIYLQNRNDFHINDYIKTYSNNLEYPLDNNGNVLDPTYIIHTVISNIKDILFNLYISTTTYYSQYNRFKMSKDIDKKLAPILQYHLAQLRYSQITIFKDKKVILTNREVFYYICNCNTLKNIIALIHYFANNNGYDIPSKASICFTVLNNLLVN